MMTKQRANRGVRAIGVLSAIFSACGGPIEAPEEGTDVEELVASGRFETTAAGAALGFDVSGTLSVVTGAEATAIRVDVRGLRDTADIYPTHLHNGRCADGGGGHYLIDPLVAPSAENEIWPTVFRVGRRGTGEAVAAHVIRADARSVVVHDPNTNTKIACADIDLNFAFGAFAPLPAGVEAGYSVQGWGAVLSRRGMTHVWVFVDGGLSPGVTYPVHAHNAPCEEGGGGHYLLDPAVAASEPNEIWPTLTADDNGRAFAGVGVRHRARVDLQSIVIHDAVTRAKVVCTNLD